MSLAKKLVDPSKDVFLFTQPSKHVIYGILNLVNGKIYIGSAVDVNHRFRTHKSKLNLNQHSNKHLQSAWNEYGSFAFEFMILENVTWKSDLIDREQHWINLTDCYNSDYGYNKRKVSTSNLGIKLGPASEERKRKLSEIHKGRMISVEQREKIRLANIGKKHSDEHRAKVSAAGKGRKFSKERNAKIGLANSKPDKWPHPDKYKCNCKECLQKKNLIRKGTYHEI